MPKKRKAPRKPNRRNQRRDRYVGFSDDEIQINPMRAIGALLDERDSLDPDMVKMLAALVLSDYSAHGASKLPEFPADPQELVSSLEELRNAGYLTVIDGVARMSEPVRDDTGTVLGAVELDADGRKFYSTMLGAEYAERIREIEAGDE